MKSLCTAFVLMFLLSGCGTTAVPVTQKFPDAPAILMSPAPTLKPIPADTTELSVLIDNANENYYNYRRLREHYEAWQQWYSEQRDNWNR